MSSSNHSSYFVHSLLRAHDWQHRPQLDEVCKWWRGGGTGVCALVGIGGAGKTAIAERFLQIIPGVMPVDEKIAKDPKLPTPHSTFVFSFYDAPNPEAFFKALQMWLEQKPRVSVVTSFFQLLFMIQKTPGLMILDGLEKVQEDGGRGLLGKLSSPKLRDFLDHVAAGHAPHLSVLVTTRFPLADLRDSKPQFFRTIPVEEIDLAAGVQLLRARGVRGTDPQLESIVRECGQHALTVDFAGGFIREYGKGNPATRLNLGTAEELAAAAEKEPDDEKRGVLKQGFRFALVAERYRDAMLKNDEAALALLERICLFRLGMDCQTLATIFTGKAARKVSGPALAKLNIQQVQQKLDWLVRMRIVEKDERGRMKDKRADSSLIPQPSSLYTIHPAVRDGFLSGIGREEMVASHEAVRLGLESSLKVSLGDKPGENPSDPATLDLLEEIVYHTIQSGHTSEALEVYNKRIGNFENLGWRLGAYERGERICRAFAGGESPDIAVQRSASQTDNLKNRATIPPYKSLLESQQAFVIADWALYLQNLGRILPAARCHELHNEMRTLKNDCENASIGNQNLCNVWLLSGRLTSGLSTAAKALQLAELANSMTEKYHSYAYRGHAHALRGDLQMALSDFADSEVWSYPWHRELTGSTYLFLEPSLLIKLAPTVDLAVRIEAMKDQVRQWQKARVVCHFDLILANLAINYRRFISAEAHLHQAREWAVTHDAKEVLCWSALVQARIELAKEKETANSAEKAWVENQCHDALTAGQKIARDCGFGIYHIDLLLERARLHLLQTNPQAALDGLSVALDTGILADDTTGQPELLAATHDECGYAWAIPEGLQLRAEAFLLQAAQLLNSDSFVVAKKPQLPAKVKALIQEAETCLSKAFQLWQPLRDPEPNNANFRHPKTGEEFNYRAAETYRVIEDLAGGVLTKYPLRPPIEPERNPTLINPTVSSTKPNRFAVALSFPGEHRDFVLEVATALADKLTRDRVFYYEWYEVELLGSGGDLKLQAIYTQADLVVPFFSKDYAKPWCALEWETIRGILLTRQNEDAVIPVHLDDTDIPGWSAVNFGIKLRGRKPNEIAELILKAHAKRHSKP